MSRVMDEDSGGVQIPEEYLEDSKEYDRKIKTRLQDEVERRLDPTNIATDSILRAYSFENDYVALEALLMVPGIKALSSGSKDILINAISDSVALELDPSGEMVRRVNELERSRLVLRSMPEDVTEVEVRKIFEHPECGQVTEIEKEAVTNTWFITFASEMDCLKTHQFLQKNSEFRPGTHVHSRVTERPPPGASSPMVKPTFDAPAGTEPAYEEFDAQNAYGSPNRGVPEATAPGITFTAEGAADNDDNCDYPDLGKVKIYDTRVFEDAVKKVMDSLEVEVPWDMAGKDVRLVLEELQQPLILVDPSEDRPPPKRPARRGRGRGRGGRGGGRGGPGYYRDRDDMGDYPPPPYDDYYGGRGRGGGGGRGRSGRGGGRRNRRYRPQSPQRSDGYGSPGGYRSMSRTASLSSRSFTRSPSRSVSRRRRRDSPVRHRSSSRSPSGRRGGASDGAGVEETRVSKASRKRRRRRRRANRQAARPASASRSVSSTRPRSRSRSQSAQRRKARRNRRRRQRRKQAANQDSARSKSGSRPPTAKKSKSTGSRRRTRRRFVKKQRSQSPVKQSSSKKKSAKKQSSPAKQRSRQKVYRRRVRSPDRVKA